MKHSVNFESFEWGWTDGTGLKDCIIDETVNRQVYEKFFEVEEDDIVLDVGASVGPFTYSILGKSPKEVHCIEPNESEALSVNTRGANVKLHHFMIGDADSQTTRKFKTFINSARISQIDFLKTDCEGGEYSIFNAENCAWIIKNVKKISGEWHLRTPEEKKKFREFRDLYLRILPHQVFSVDDVNIKWDLWNDHFIDYYTEVIVYIDNRPAKPMKTAVLVSGQVRGFKHIVKNLETNLLAHLGEVDTYFYLDDSAYRIDSFFSADNIKYEKDIEHDAEGLNNFYGHSRSTPQKFLQQWYSLYACKRMMLDSGKEYDLIVRTRPDNDFITPLTLDMLNLNAINVCKWGDWGGYNDRFAIGPAEHMITYCDFYLHCKKYDGNSESRLQQYLTSKSVPVSRIDHVHYRINEDGSRREHP